MVCPLKSEAEALAQARRNLVDQLAGFVPLGVLDWTVPAWPWALPAYRDGGWRGLRDRRCGDGGGRRLHDRGGGRRRGRRRVG